MKIELILLGVIGIVFLIDFILNARKKGDNPDDLLQIKGDGSSTTTKNRKTGVNLLSYVLDRKKNISLSIIIISVVKILTHFYFYRLEGFYTLSSNRKEAYLMLGDRVTKTKKAFMGKYIKEKEGSSDELDFLDHIEQLFYYDLWLFIPSTLIVLFIAWYFNDKIKAR